MPTPTYTPLANVTLGSAASSVTFGSIPATYRDLIIVGVAAGSTGLGVRARFNGDTGSFYSFQAMHGTGSSAFATAQQSIAQIVLTNSVSANVGSLLQFQSQFMDYSTTNKHKAVLSRGDNAANGTEAIVAQWANTAAINSIQLITSSGNFSIGSTFALYGVIA